VAITKQKKEEVVRDASRELDGAKVVIFTDFKGMDMFSISLLRNKIREVGGRYVVVKKTLLNRVLGERKIEGLSSFEMEGQIAVVFGTNDSVATAKAVYEIKKEVGLPNILGGIMDGSVLTAEEIIHLASLPAREELLAKLVGSINAPISGFVNVLAGNIRGLVYTLNAIKEQKS